MRSASKPARRAFALLFITACGTGSASLPTNDNSGAETLARLRAKVWAVDGVELHRWFFDSKRNEDCAFLEDGVANTGPGPTYWCLPRSSVRHDATGGLAIFADKACTVPLALESDPNARTAYVIRRGANACNEAPRVYRAEAAQTVRPYFLDGADCSRAPATIPAHALGEEIPLTEFVSAAEAITPLAVAGSIARLELVSSDGARQTIGGFDAARRFAVAPGDPGGKGDRRWFPARIAFEGAGTVLYADRTCTQTVPTKVARDAICPLGASFLFEGECGEGAYHALKDAVDASKLFEKSALGTCLPAAPAIAPPSVVAYERGDELPRAAFIAAPETRAGAGRIRLIGYGDGLSTVLPSSLFDTQTSSSCTPAVAADGTTRCLPSATASVDLFADVACAKPAFEEPIGACALPTASPTWVRQGTRAYRVVGVAGAVYEKKTAGCARHLPAGPARAFEVAEVDAAQFAVVAEVTR